jgi:hypothetical protein
MITEKDREFIALMRKRADSGAMTEEEYQSASRIAERIAEVFRRMKISQFRQHRTPEMEREFLDYLRSRGVEGSAIGIVEDLLKRVKPTRDKRGRPKGRPRADLAAGHPRTLRRHRREHEKWTEEAAWLRGAMSDARELEREWRAIAEAYERQQGADKKSMN